MLNILFTLILGLLSITVFDKLGKKYYFSVPLVLIIIYLGKLFRVDYGWYGVAAVFVLYLFRNKKFLKVLGFALLNFVYYYPRLITNYSVRNLISYIFATVPVVILLAYNGKLGKKTKKYVYYIFYPVHMIILFLLNVILR